MGLSGAAGSIGFRSLGVKIDYHTLQGVPLPAILQHFVVLYEVKTKRGKDILYVSDPAHELMTYTKE